MPIIFQIVSCLVCALYAPCVHCIPCSSCILTDVFFILSTVSLFKHLVNGFIFCSHIETRTSCLLIIVVIR